MTYRDELGQAHQRIEQLEEELREERAKQEPAVSEPVTKRIPTNPAPRVKRIAPAPTLPWWAWWPFPSRSRCSSLTAAQVMERSSKNFVSRTTSSVPRTTAKSCDMMEETGRAPDTSECFFMASSWLAAMFSSVCVVFIGTSRT